MGISSVFPGANPGRRRLELLGRRRGSDRIFRNGRRQFVTKVNHFYNGAVKTLLLIPTISLLLITLFGCSWPSEEEVAAKASEVVPRAQQLLLTASFAADAECRELADEFTKAFVIDDLPYDHASTREAMANLEIWDKGLDEFEKDLKKADCIP